MDSTRYIYNIYFYLYLYTLVTIIATIKEHCHRGRTYRTDMYVFILVNICSLWAIVGTLMFQIDLRKKDQCLFQISKCQIKISNGHVIKL